MIWLRLFGGWLSGLPRWVWYALGVAVLAWAIHHHGDKSGYARGHAELVKYQDQVIADIAKQEAINKAKEVKDRLAFDAAATLLEKRNAETKANADRTIADIRAGNLRLRNRFTCPSSAAEVTGSATGSDGAGQAGLLGSDAEFLISEAERADKVVNQLTACQNILKAERITE